MKRLRISMGAWGNTNLPDRLNISGFGEPVPVLDRTCGVGEIEGVDSIELHLLTEISEQNADAVGRALEDHGRQILRLCGHTWEEKQYKHGALAGRDPLVRRAAADRVKAALDMGARFRVPISVLWSATDGNDFPRQSNCADLYARYVESVCEILDYRRAQGYGTRLCIEPKPFEPGSHIMMGSRAQALCLVSEIDDPGPGLNVDIGHSLIAGESLEGQLAVILRCGKLYHTRLNGNDQQCDADLPRGTVSFTRLVAVTCVLDEAGYDGWYGLDLFPYRDWRGRSSSCRETASAWPRPWWGR